MTKSLVLLQNKHFIAEFPPSSRKKIMLEYLKIAFSAVNFIPSFLLLMVVILWLALLFKVIAFEKIENKLMPYSLSQKLKEEKYIWLGKLLHIENVPFTMYLSIFILMFWSLQCYINYPDSPLNPAMEVSSAIIYLLPSILSSILLAYVLLLPLNAQFAQDKAKDKEE